jgi:hypothetical protein
MVCLGARSAQVEPRSVTPLLTYFAAHAWASEATPDHEIRAAAAATAAAVVRDYTWGSNSFQGQG